MNQIPNIEEEKRQVLDTTNKILALIPHIDGFKYSSINHKVDEILHQQLQKAREEERERIEKDLDRRLEIQKKVSHSEYEGGYTHALQDVKEALHSELDQPNK